MVALRAMVGAVAVAIVARILRSRASKAQRYLERKMRTRKYTRRNNRSRIAIARHIIETLGYKGFLYKTELLGLFARNVSACFPSIPWRQNHASWRHIQQQRHRRRRR